MYQLGALGESDAFPVLGVKLPFSQSAVDQRWQEIGRTLPAPIMPKGLDGKYVYRLGKGGIRMVADRYSASAGGRHVTTEENNFLNYWGQVAVDPFHKQSGISKVAGAALQVVSVVIPAAGVASAISAAGNAGIAKAQAGSNEKAADQIMSAAFDADTAKKNAAADQAAALQAQKLQSLATGAGLSTTLTSSPKTPPGLIPSAPVSRNVQIAIAATALALAIMLVLRR